MKWLVLAVLISVPACPAWTQEVSVFTGMTQQIDPDDHSLAAQIEYKEHLSWHWAWSFSYLNEGHFPDHHRDGGAGQLWFRANARENLSLDAGIGPYYYFDTVKASNDDGYANDHGWGLIGSLGATWHARNHVLFQLRGNWIAAGRSIDRYSVMLGVGYELASSSSKSETEHHPETANNEITIFLGRAILNSFGSEKATAASVEYRHRIWRHVDWTAAWLYEGHNSVVTRNGFSAQLWGVQDFFEDRLSLGAGAGVYRAVDVDSVNRKDNNRLFSGIISFTGSYRIYGQWNIRILFHRIVTDYNKDSDVILIGIGYRF